MKFLVTGNLGYIGTSIIQQLRSSNPKAEIIGLDIGLFSHCLSDPTTSPDIYLNKQIFKDVRKITSEDLEGVDSVIHLAAISNDPMGKQFERITNEINYQSSISLAKLSAKSGVSNYVFASSCSVYGTASLEPKTKVLL